jgi:hypothetical protein
MWNLIGVLMSTGGVAFGIVALLCVELVVIVGSGAGELARCQASISRESLKTFP